MLTMKLAKSHKIILIITALALSLMMAFCALNLFSTKAAEPIASPDASNYFSNATTAEFVDGGVKLGVDSNKKVAVKNELAIEDMKIELGNTDGVKSLNLVLTYKSFYVNGNKNSDGFYVKDIKNTFDVTGKDVIEISVDENNFVKVNGDDKNQDKYYRLRKADIALAKIEFEVTLNDGATQGSFIVKSIDQDVSSEGKNKQSFALADGKLNVAAPVIAINSGIFAKDADGKYIAYANENYNVNCKSYSVIESKTTGFSVTNNEDVKVAGNDKTYVHFKSLDGEATEKATTLTISDKDNNSVTYDFKVVKKYDKNATDEQNSAPKYVYDEEAIAAFKSELKNQYMKNGELVPLGTKITIPSMEDFVIDDRTPYAKLTKRIYVSSKTDKNSSSLEITLDNVGEYTFYVTFTDAEEKGMEASDFVEFNEDDSLKGYGKYGPASEGEEKENKEGYIYSFVIDKDTEIVITAPSKQGNGYKGTRYTASKFEILSAGANKNTFKLEYTDKETPTEEDWVEIKKFSEINEDYKDDNYDYETLKAINYNGEYSFTPDKVGKYRITVYVSSPLSVMSNSASTIIEVNEEAKVITPSVATWIKDNVWSVVFLSVGTLCLAGIIVLLCIKPKEKKDDEE